MKKELLNKFTKYAALAGATVIAGNANADVVYTDIDPDSLLDTNGELFILNIDGQGANDLSLRLDLNTSGSNYLVANEGQAIGYLSGGYNYLSFLNNSALISSSQTFVNLPFASFTTGSSNYYGQSANFTDKFVGFTLTINSNTHYGWVKLDAASQWTSVTVKGYAYNDVPNQSIYAGDTSTFADTAQSLLLADTANNISPLDMELTFNAAADENGVLEYRAFVVKTADIATIDLDSARNVSNFAPITPDGSSSYSISPEIDGQDINGDSIVHGVSYTAFVLSVPDVPTASNHSLTSSNELTLTYSAESVSNLIATDIADNYNGSDIEISFNKINDESSISEYTIFVVKSTSASSFDLASAEANSNGISIAPIDINISQVLPLTAKDSDGDLIATGVAYKVFVLSVGESGVNNTLSEESNEITLNGVDGVNKSLFDNTIITNNESTLNINSDIIIESVSIFDINGSLITLENSNTKQLSVNINKMNSGIYFAVLNTEKGVLNHKFVK